MNIENYEIIQNSKGNMIAINSSPEIDLQSFKELYFGKFMNIKTHDGQTITFPRMNDEIVSQIKKGRTVMVASFEKNKMVDAIEIKVLR